MGCSQIKKLKTQTDIDLRENTYNFNDLKCFSSSRNFQTEKNTVLTDRNKLWPKNSAASLSYRYNEVKTTQQYLDCQIQNHKNFDMRASKAFNIGSNPIIKRRVISKTQTKI